MEVPKEPFICIDPGINIGIAGFYPELKTPVLTNSILGPENIPWDLKNQVVLFKYEYILSKYMNQYRLIYIERPKFMEHGYAGRNAARSDALVKLCSTWGVICYISRKLGMQVKDVEIGKWKGQLGKEQINARIKRAINVDFPNHVADAVAIGLYLKGLL